MSGLRVEVIATGNEILFGRIVDTNSSWIARRISEAGARLKRITCVGDDMDDLVLSLKEALDRSNHLIIFTGGLGPSEDDVTIQAIAKGLRRDIELNPEALAMIREKCAELGIESTSRRERMASLLSGSKPLLNPIGMAAGMVIQEGGTTIVTLPGVPEEMKVMFDCHIAPIVENKSASKFLAKTVFVRIVWNNFFPVYRSLIDDFNDVYLKHGATPPLKAEERKKVREFKMDVVVESPSKEEDKRKIDAVLDEFKKRFEANGGKLIIP